MMKKIIVILALALASCSSNDDGADIDLVELKRASSAPAKYSGGEIVIRPGELNVPGMRKKGTTTITVVLKIYEDSTYTIKFNQE